MIETIVRRFLDYGKCEEAYKYLRTIPAALWDEKIRALFNIVQHRCEAKRLEGSFFPETLLFEDRWKGPHLGHGKPASWFPGILHRTKGDVARFELAEPPEDSEDPTAFGLEIPFDEFLLQIEATDLIGNLKLDEELARRVFCFPHFVEVHVLSMSNVHLENENRKWRGLPEIGDQRIYFHPQRFFTDLIFCGIPEVKTDIALLHERINLAIEGLSGSQQPPHWDSEPTDEDLRHEENLNRTAKLVCENVARDVVMALTGKEINFVETEENS